MATLGDYTPPATFVGWHQFRHQIDGESATPDISIRKARSPVRGRDYILPA